MVEMPDEKEEKFDEGQLARVYLAILSRYKDYIEEKESLSVAELPTLVRPDSERVLERAEEIKKNFGMYSYEKDFYSAGKAAFDFTKKIEDIALQIQFWLTPDDTIALMMGDLLDRNIVLCSLLVALGNPSSKVFVKVKDSLREIFVYCEFTDRLLVFDLNNGVKEFYSREAMLDSFDIKNEVTAYEFNNSTYANIV